MLTVWIDRDISLLLFLLAFLDDLESVEMDSMAEVDGMCSMAD